MVINSFQKRFVMNMQLRQCIPELSFSDWKKPDFVWKKSQILSDFVWLFDFRKKTKMFKKRQNFKIWLQKSQIGDPANNCRTGTHALQYCLWRNKQNSFITMDGLIKTIWIECTRGGQTPALWAFRNLVFLFLHIVKCRNIAKWYCGQWRICA